MARRPAAGWRRRAGHAARAACLTAAALLLVPAAQAAPGPGALARAEVVEIVARVRGGSAEERDLALTELSELGTRAVPEVWNVLAGRAERPADIDGALLDAEGKALLLRALDSWPGSLVVAQLDGLVRAGDGEDHLRALEWIGRVGDADALPALLRHLVALPSSYLGHPRLSGTIRGAVSNLLTRDERALRQLSLELRKLQPPHLEVIARALPAVGSDQAFLLLERLFSRSRTLDRAALDALAQWPLWTRPAADGRCAMLARRHLDAADPELRRRAVLALGTLRDGLVTDELLLRLEDTDTRVRRGAEWALQRISGCTWSGSPARWERWWQEERKWWHANQGRLIDLGASPDPRELEPLLRELVMHPAMRQEYAEVLAAALNSHSPSLARAAAGALAHLELAGEADELIRALERDDEGLRNAASMALVTLTGRSEASSAEQWRALLGLD